MACRVAKDAIGDFSSRNARAEPIGLPVHVFYSVMRTQPSRYSHGKH